MDDGGLATDLARLFDAGRRVQDSRLLRMDFPREDGPSDTALLVNSLRAHEEMSRDFRFEAELLSDNLHVPLTAMMGRMVTISMVRDDGSLRFLMVMSVNFACCAAIAVLRSTRWCCNRGYGLFQVAHGQRLVPRTRSSTSAKRPSIIMYSATGKTGCMRKKRY